MSVSATTTTFPPCDPNWWSPRVITVASTWLGIAFAAATGAEQGDVFSTSDDRGNIVADARGWWLRHDDEFRSRSENCLQLLDQAESHRQAAMELYAQARDPATPSPEATRLQAEGNAEYRQVSDLVRQFIECTRGRAPAPAEETEEDFWSRALADHPECTELIERHRGMTLQLEDASDRAAQATGADRAALLQEVNAIAAQRSRVQTELYACMQFDPPADAPPSNVRLRGRVTVEETTPSPTTAPDNSSDPRGGTGASGRRAPSTFAISDVGLHHLENSEGYRDKIYLDSARKPTIGIGHLLRPGERRKFAGGITREEARELLRQDLTAAQNAVRRAVKVPLSQNEFDALTNFTFNVGNGAFRKSTLVKLLNQGDRAGASSQFGRWVRAGGRPVQGLVNRRARERALFNGAGRGNSAAAVPSPALPTAPEV